MIRQRLAAVILTAGLSLLSGCTGCYSFGRFNNGNFFSRFPGACWNSGYEADSISGLEAGPMLVPPDGVTVVPSPGVPVAPPPVGSATRLTPVPQSTPTPYTP